MRVLLKVHAQNTIVAAEWQT